MKVCVVIPCFNHAATVASVAAAARKHGPVIIVDDGSTDPIPPIDDCPILRLDHNFGKGHALQAGFSRARELGFSHVVTMDADGQHSAEDLPELLSLICKRPDALIIGVRNFAQAGAPFLRKIANQTATLAFRRLTRLSLPETQCGFRSYPLGLAQQLKVASGRYAFETEFLIRAAWGGVEILPTPVRCAYSPQHLRDSHFRALPDFAEIALTNCRLAIERFTNSRPAPVASLLNNASPGSPEPAEPALP